jgi:GNAT superfamily N-acetyltransferase
MFIEGGSMDSSGVVVRRAVLGDESGIAEVQVSAWKITYRGLISQEVLEGLSVSAKVAMWRKVIDTASKAENRKTVLVAVDADSKIVGFLAGGQSRDSSDIGSAELNAIYIDPAQQGAGIGTKLVKKFVSWLLVTEFTQLRVWALASNPCRRFYEKLGGQELAEIREITIGGIGYDEVAFEWFNLDELNERLAGAPN